MSDDKILAQNRNTLLERMSESGNAYSSDYPYGLMMEAEEEIKLLRKERDEARGEVCELVSKDCGELDLYGADREAKRRGWATYNR